MIVSHQIFNANKICTNINLLISFKNKSIVQIRSFHQIVLAKNASLFQPIVENQMPRLQATCRNNLRAANAGNQSFFTTTSGGKFVKAELSSVF